MEIEGQAQGQAQRQAIKALAGAAAQGSETHPGPQNTTTCAIHISTIEDTKGAKGRRGVRLGCQMLIGPS